MSLPSSTVQRENEKFEENSNGDVAVRSIIDPDQIIAITPPAAITGFATSAKQDSIISVLDSPAQEDGNLATIAAVDFATSAKQDDAITELKDRWATNDIDDYTTTDCTYIGKEKKDGTWWIKKLDETGNFLTINHASVSNNPTLTSYTLAWNGRVTATYEDYASAF